MGVSVQGEPGAIVAQHPARRLDIHAILQGHRGERMTQVMEANVRETSPLQQNFQLSVGGARIGGLFRLQRVGEYPFGEGGLLFFVLRRKICVYPRLDPPTLRWL